MELNQKSIAVIIAALGLVALFAVSYFTIRHRADAALAEKAKAAAAERAVKEPPPVKKDPDKEKETLIRYGGQCKAAIEYLAASAKTYMAKKSAYPLSMGDLVEFDPRAEEMVNNRTYWVENGAPDIDSFFAEKFTIAGYCSNGFKYFYDSEIGQLQHEQF